MWDETEAAIEGQTPFSLFGRHGDQAETHPGADRELFGVVSKEVDLAECSISADSPAA